jgi:hypothetical protein
VFIADTGVPVDMLAIDSKYIYWGFRGVSTVSPFDGSIWRAKLADPSAAHELVASGIRPDDLVVSEAKQFILWTQHNEANGVSTISFVSVEGVGGGYTSQVYADQKNPILSFMITPTSAIMAWASFAEKIVYYDAFPPMPVPNDAPIAFDLEPTPSELFVVNDLVYYHGPEQIRCVTLSASSACVQGSITASNKNGFGLDVFGNNAYWTNKEAAGTVWASAIEGSNKPVELVLNQSYPTYITSDFQGVYWATNGEASCSGTEAAVRMKPFAPSDPMLPGYTLASKIPCPSNFAVSSGNSEFYWGAGKTIYRMPKIGP